MGVEKTKGYTERRYRALRREETGWAAKAGPVTVRHREFGPGEEPVGHRRDLEEIDASEPVPFEVNAQTRCEEGRHELCANAYLTCPCPCHDKSSRLTLRRT